MTAGTTSIIIVPLLSLAKEEKKEKDDGASTPLVSVYSEKEGDDGMDCTNSNRDPSTPVKLTVSFLGILKTVISTPKTMSPVLVLLTVPW